MGPIPFISSDEKLHLYLNGFAKERCLRYTESRSASKLEHCIRVAPLLLDASPGRLAA